MAFAKGKKVVWCVSGWPRAVRYTELTLIGHSRIVLHFQHDGVVPTYQQAVLTRACRPSWCVYINRPLKASHGNLAHR